MQARGTCIVDLFIYWRNWSCHRFVTIMQVPRGWTVRFQLEENFGQFSESPLTRQTCAGTHLVGTSDGVHWIGPVNDVAMQAGAIIDVVMWYVCRALGV